MTNTYTVSETFTITHARYLASKVAADLLQMQLFYGHPSNEEISKYIEELVILLLEGCLDSVDYGYRKDNNWVISLKYSARFGDVSSTDDRSGGVYPGVNITGATWGSYLRKNSFYDNLNQPEKDRIEQSLPIKRTGQAEPGYHSGTWGNNKNYFNGGASLERQIFRPY